MKFKLFRFISILVFANLSFCFRNNIVELVTSPSGDKLPDLLPGSAVISGDSIVRVLLMCPQDTRNQAPKLGLYSTDGSIRVETYDFNPQNSIVAFPLDGNYPSNKDYSICYQTSNNKWCTSQFKVSGYSGASSVPSCLQNAAIDCSEAHDFSKAAIVNNRFNFPPLALPFNFIADYDSIAEFIPEDQNYFDVFSTSISAVRSLKFKLPTGFYNSPALHVKKLASDNTIFIVLPEKPVVSALIVNLNSGTSSRLSVVNPTKIMGNAKLLNGVFMIAVNMNDRVAFSNPFLYLSDSAPVVDEFGLNTEFLRFLPENGIALSNPIS